MHTRKLLAYRESAYQSMLWQKEFFLTSNLLCSFSSVMSCPLVLLHLYFEKHFGVKLQKNKKKSLHHIVTDVDQIGQCHNGLTHMDHISLHTSHVKLWHVRFVFNPLSQSGLSHILCTRRHPIWQTLCRKTH